MMTMTTTTILLLMWLFSSLFGSFNDGAWPGQSDKTMEHNGNLQSFSWRMERWLIYVLGYARDARSGPVHRGAAHFLINLPFFLHEVWAMALTCRIWPIKRQLWAFSLCCFFGRALNGQVPEQWDCQLLWDSRSASTVAAVIHSFWPQARILDWDLSEDGRGKMNFPNVCSVIKVVEYSGLDPSTRISVIVWPVFAGPEPHDLRLAPLNKSSNTWWAASKTWIKILEKEGALAPIHQWCILW